MPKQKNIDIEGLPSIDGDKHPVNPHHAFGAGYRRSAGHGSPEDWAILNRIDNNNSDSPPMIFTNAVSALAGGAAGTAKRLVNGIGEAGAAGAETLSNGMKDLATTGHNLARSAAESIHEAARSTVNQGVQKMNELEAVIKKTAGAAGDSVEDAAGKAGSAIREAGRTLACKVTSCEPASPAENPAPGNAADPASIKGVASNGR